MGKKSHIFQCSPPNISCIKTEYKKFDKICKKETKLNIKVEDIINNSEYCRVLTNSDQEIFNIKFRISDQLKGLSGKEGVYHLWVHVESCDDHNIHKLLCIYAGKGEAKIRVRQHIKKKWPESQGIIYMSFYECENRIAKYIEQLFLDTYNFELNTIENPGEENLYARWDDDRYCFGTQLYEDAEILTEKGISMD